MTIPLRIQRRRTAGWKMPGNTIYVGRAKGDASRWSNPFRRDHDGTWMHCLSLGIEGDDQTDRATAAVDLFQTWLTGGKVNELVWAYLPVVDRPPTLRIIQRDLAGKNLSCWCKLCAKHESGKPLNEACPDCAPCHVDPLGRIANGFECG